MEYMEIAVTKLSTKGQVVLPANIRKGMHKGDTLFMKRQQNKIIIQQVEENEKPCNKIEAQIIESFFKEISECKDNKKRLKLLDDFTFAWRTEQAAKEIDDGESVSGNFDDLIKGM